MSNYKYNPNFVEADEFNKRLRDEIAARQQAMRMSSPAYIGYKANRVIDNGGDPRMFGQNVPQQYNPQVVRAQQGQMFRSGGFVYVPIPESELLNNPFKDNMGYAQSGQQYNMEMTRGDAGFINNLVNMAKKRRLLKENPDMNAQQINEEMRRIGNFKNYYWSPVASQQQDTDAVQTTERAGTDPQTTTTETTTTETTENPESTVTNTQTTTTGDQGSTSTTPISEQQAAATRTTSTPVKNTSTTKKVVTKPSTPFVNNSQADAAASALEATPAAASTPIASATSTPTYSKTFGHKLIDHGTVFGNNPSPLTKEDTESAIKDYLIKNPGSVYNDNGIFNPKVYFIDANGNLRQTYKSNYDWAKDNNVSMQEWQRQRDSGKNPNMKKFTGSAEALNYLKENNNTPVLLYKGNNVYTKVRIGSNGNLEEIK